MQPYFFQDYGFFFFFVTGSLEYTLVPEVFLFFSDEKAAKLRARVVKWQERKTSGYLGLKSHFHADAGCQTHQVYNYKMDQWQVGNHVLTNQTNQSY